MGNKKYDLFLSKNVPKMSDHVGCRLIFFPSVVGKFFLVLSVVSYIFRRLSLVS